MENIKCWQECEAIGILYFAGVKVKWHIYFAELFDNFFVTYKITMKVKVSQSCLTLCYPVDYTIYGIPQARILVWVAFPFSRGSSQPRARIQVSHTAGGFFTSWATIAIHPSNFTARYLFYARATKIYIHPNTHECISNS